MRRERERERAGGPYGGRPGPPSTRVSTRAVHARRARAVGGPRAGQARAAAPDRSRTAAPYRTTPTASPAPAPKQAVGMMSRGVSIRPQ